MEKQKNEKTSHPPGDRCPRYPPDGRGGDPHRAGLFPRHARRVGTDTEAPSPNPAGPLTHHHFEPFFQQGNILPSDCASAPACLVVPLLLLLLLRLLRRLLLLLPPPPSSSILFPPPLSSSLLLPAPPSSCLLLLPVRRGLHPPPRARLAADLKSSEPGTVHAAAAAICRLAVAAEGPAGPRRVIHHKYCCQLALEHMGAIKQANFFRELQHHEE